MRFFVLLLIALGVAIISHGNAGAVRSDSRSSYTMSGGAPSANHSNYRLFERQAATIPDTTDSVEQACQDTAPVCSGPAETRYGKRTVETPAHEKNAGRRTH